MIREATIEDITQIQIIRNSVKENTLSDPALVPDSAVEEYIIIRGKGWVYETDGIIMGFAIADLKDNNIWALFLHPNIEGTGAGKALHKLMLDWYFTQTKETVWLSTDFNSRAAIFYKMQGWKDAGEYGKGEIKFEMDFITWSQKSRN